MARFVKIVSHIADQRGSAGPAYKRRRCRAADEFIGFPFTAYYQDISRLHGDRMPDVGIGQIGIECRRNQAQVWASALLDNDAVAIDPHKTISSK